MPASIRIWQLKQEVNWGNMAYVLRVEARSAEETDKIVVIDGGNPTTFDVKRLLVLLRELGGDVYAWFITHPHPDHAGALKAILEDKPEFLTIRTVYHSPAQVDGNKYENVSNSQIVITFAKWAGYFYVTLEQAANRFHTIGSLQEVALDQIIDVNGTSFEILWCWHPEKMNDNLMFNNNCLVIKVVGGPRSILFLADLQDVGGEALVQHLKINHRESELNAAYLQMPHHGNPRWTVDYSFFRYVQPKILFWPTPERFYPYSRGSQDPVQGCETWLRYVFRSMLETWFEIDSVNSIASEEHEDDVSILIE